ncbi:hypothetical protein [Spirosoma spitsbergense]|uniref:hypothetical protein n=1 Tax=Spirosoma spitsbergense TaxID=431554 RepID=UPI000378A09A|nr:hypothetical protein [Spirosoma spitsbergense]
MPITTVKRGERVFREAEFGTGDIIIMKAKECDQASYDDMIILTQDGSKGEISRDAGYAGKTTDEIPMTCVPISLKFNRAASVRVLIDDLIEIESNLITAGK